MASPPQNRTKVWHMTPKAHPLKNHLPHVAISVDALFAAAFHKSLGIFQRESLLGWRPVMMDAAFSAHQEPLPSIKKEPASFSNSPDVKVREASGIITIEVELPDIDEESLYLEVSGNLLIIRAEKIPQKRTRSQPVRSHKTSMVNRYVKLPFAAKPGQIQARLDGEILRIRIGDPLANFRETDSIER
jgi:HSP20 family molecular chaperone IbpA